MHATPQLTNTWILGVLCVIFALAATQLYWVRYVNTALAVWLFISAFALGGSRGTLWSNALTAIAIFIVSLTPSERLQLPAGPPRTA